MRVKDVRATAVNVPMVAPYRFAFGSLASFTTTIVEVEDEDGVVGIGESPHGDLVREVEVLGAALGGDANRRPERLRGARPLANGVLAVVAGRDRAPCLRRCRDRALGSQGAA